MKAFAFVQQRLEDIFQGQLGGFNGNDLQVQLLQQQCAVGRRGLGNREEMGFHGFFEITENAIDLLAIGLREILIERVQGNRFRWLRCSETVHRG